MQSLVKLLKMGLEENASAALNFLDEKDISEISSSYEIAQIYEVSHQLLGVLKYANEAYLSYTQEISLSNSFQ